MSQIDDFLNDGPQPQGGSQTARKPDAVAKPKSQVDAFLADAPAPDRGLGGFARDAAAWAVKGAIAVPEAIVGLADIPTGGRVGKALENEGGTFGFRPKQAREIVNEWHSDATKEAQRKFQEAEGLGGKFQAAIENPSNIAGAVIESLPAMGAGGVIGRGALAATRLGQMGSKGAVVAGALGEGAVMAGSQAEGIRQETDDGLLTPGQAGAALATGAIGAGLGYAGGKLANKLGVGNAETMLAQGTQGMAKQFADEAADAAANPLMVQAAKGIPRQVIEGALVEGVFEELPQSVTETIIQNLALDKPWSEGLDEAIVLGVLSGGAMGGAAAGYKGFAAPQADTSSSNTAKQAADKAAQEQDARKADALQRVQQAWQQQAQLLAEQEAGEPEVPQTAPPDAAAMLAQQRAQEAQARQAEIDAGRAMASPDDEIYESTGTTMRPSEAMGLNPTAGGLEGAAALAVDTGASAAVQAAAQYIDPDDMPDAGADAPLSAASAVADTAPEDPFAGYERDYDELSDLEKELYDWEMTQREAPDEAFAALAELDDSDIPFFDRASNATDEDFLRALGASDEEIADALTTANQSASTQSHAASTAETQTNEPRGPRQSAGQGQEAEQVIQQQLPTDPAARIAELEAIAKDADAQARDWASRTYKHNPKPLPEHEAKGGPADVGEANEQRRLKAIADAKQRAAEARAEITRLQEQGNTQAQLAAKAPSVADLAAISRKQIPDMTDAELVALASATSPEHGRFKKLQKALQSRGLQAQAATNKGVTENGTQASQTQQAGTQQQQAGAAVGQAIDGVPAGAAAQAAGQAAGTSTVTATQKTGNDGAQAAAQGEAVAKAIAQEGNARREAERQRKLEASERWTRMTAAERQAAAANAKGLNAIQKKNVHTKPWADLSDKVRAALLDVVSPQTATENKAPNADQRSKVDENAVQINAQQAQEAIKIGVQTVKHGDYELQFDREKGEVTATLNGKTVGEMSFEQLRDGSYNVSDMSVDADHRRKGVARAMLDMANEGYRGKVTFANSVLTEDGARFAAASALADTMPTEAREWAKKQKFIAALDAARKELPPGFDIESKGDSISLMENGKHAVNGLNKNEAGIQEAVRLAKKRAAEAKPAAASNAPEHQQVGVDDRELAEIVDEFNAAQERMAEDEGRIHHLFDNPAKDEVVRLQDKVKVYHAEHGWMTPDEAKARIAEWKAHAQAQGETNANANKVVLSLFDYTGQWSKPWEEAGYQVYRFDIQNDPEVGDVNNFSQEFFSDWFGDFDGQDIYAILAACPCTDFASSGARHFAAKDADGRTVASVKLVHQTLATIEHFKPAVWAIENPVGRIEKLGGLPQWRLSFDPNHLGDPYTKKTLLWGRFNGDLPIAPVEPTEGSKMHSKYGGSSLATKNARSVTPEGFAYGFFMANNAIDHPVMAVANKYDRLDRDVVAQAVKAGLTPSEIDALVEDHYYMDLDDKAAEQALRDAISQRDSNIIEVAASEAATHPDSNAPEPTQAQKEAGNYKKGHVRINGHDISIENPAGTSRRPEWPALKNHYGYFKGSVGADKDHVDVFLTDRADDASLPVFVVDQNNQDGSFDEHKVIMGAATEAEARQTYLQNYEKGWTGLGAITQMTQDEFKSWVYDPSKTKKPADLSAADLAAELLRAARAKMEDHGLSVDGMDSPEQVRAELQKLATEPQTKETENAGTAVHGSGTAPLGAVATGNDQGNARTGDAEPRSADGQQARSEAGGRPDGAGDAAARSGGNGTSAGNSVSARKSRRSVKKAKGAPKAATLQEQAAEEIKEASPVNIPGIDFTITDEVKLGQGTEAVKYADNIAAIRTLKQIEQEQRRATPEEQRILARYVGWGGLKNAFRVAGAREGEGVAKGWEKRVEELESLLTPAELRAARNSTTAAHYTSETVVKALWKGVQRLGFRGGAVLEPSVGTGNFLGLMPQELRGTSKTLAVEYDSLTARIAQHLYPNQTILHSGFQDVPLPDGKFALAIGNPPFGRESLFFRHNPALNGKSIHNQFFIQSLQSLQDDGIMGMVVSHNLMDAQDQASRLSMAISAEFVGAIRLPDTAFKENARTEVVTDILFFRKRSAVDLHHAAKAVELMRSPVAKHDKILEGLSPNEVERAKEIYAEMQRWVPSSKQENFAGSGETISVNPYFLNNPQMVIGRMDASGTMNGRRELNVVLEDTSAFATMLDKAVQQLPERAPVDAVAQRTLAQFDQLATAMRLAVNRAEPGAVRRTLDGQLKVVLEMDDPEGNSRKTLLTEFDLNAETPWEEGYTLRSDGKWQREDDKLGEDGKPIKQLKKDGTPSNLNVKEITVYDDLAQIPEKHKWGAARIAVITDLLPLRDGLKHQLMLEASDAPEAMIEDNRKRLNDLYKAFKKKHGELHKSGTVKIAMTMPDGALALALEQLDKNGKAHPADILQRRVTVPPKPIDRVKSAGEAVAVVLAERGHIDLERVAQLLGTDEKGAMDALSEGDNPRAFYDPETGTWEPADAYLSGLVRRKLLAAKAAGLEKNVAALEKVQPEDWDATQITPNIGSAWIPGEVYADFLKHLGFSKASVHYSAATNTFTVAADGKPKAEWSGSDRALPTASIVERLMNSRPIKVQYKDSDGKPVVDEEATLESQMKAAEISNEFLDWAFADDDRREQLVQIFNEKYNTRVVRQRDGSHLTLPGKVPDSVIKMRPWQLNAVWRGITDNAVLYDHAVGAGKTFTAIARIMERRRMGLSKKPMVVVPNHLVEQWAADARKLYPGANILAATKHDFDKQRRRRLFARIGSGDYDMVIVGHSSFNFIDIDPSTEERYLDEELRIAYEAVQEAEAAAAEAGFSGWGKPMGVAEAERLVKKLEERMAKVRSAKRDRLLTFEEMGIDDLTVDEAHEFKNLAYSSKLQGVSGMGNKTGSAKAMDLNLKIRSLRERPGTSVAFLTGTPVSNSVAEMYLVLRNLAHQELKEMGMENFDAWRTQYVSASSAYEPTESGSLKEVTRLGREWMNMKSLMDLYYSVADAVTLQDMKDEFARVNPGKSFPVPKVRSQVNGEGDRAMVAVKPSKEQQTILRQIVSGFEGLQFIKNRKERGAERLRLMDRARKVSLDARAVDPSIHVEPGTGKIGAVVDNVFKTYQKWDEDKGTQIIFLDRSVPKSKGDDKILAAYDKLVNDLQKATNDGNEEEVANIEEKLEKYDANEMEELRNAQNGGWNAYEEIKRQLVAKGIPANEIRFVQEANNDAQKAALFKQVNSGEVRVLIGSTPRMGAGTNVQERLVALHHVDVTWKPSDIEQREGRIVRQGNHLLEKYGEDFTVDVIAYATEMTVDAKMWSLNATKLKAINGIRKYDGSFSMEFEDEESASMAEMAALATGNPLMVERVQLDGEIKKLEMAERSFTRRLNGVRGQLRQAERTIEQGPAHAQRLRAFAQQMENMLAGVRKRSDARRVTVNGQEFTSAAEAELAAMESVEKQQAESATGKGRYVVEINGEKATSRDRIQQLIRENLGDKDFEAEVDGQKYVDIGHAVRAIMDKHGPASSRGREFTLDGITINGMKVELDIAPSRWRPNTDSVMTMHILDGDGRPMVSRDYQYESVTLTGNSMRAGLQVLLKQFAPELHLGDAAAQERQVERAKRDLPELQEQAKKTSPYAEELAKKRDRLQEVVAQLRVSSDSARLSDAEQSAEAGEAPANFGHKSSARVGTPSDRAVMDMVREGRSAQDALKFIAGASRNPFNRKVARLLLRTGINPKLTMGEPMGGADGFTFLAKYNRPTDTVTMTDGAGYMAEQILLHELVHAATLKALDKRSLHSLQMRKLYEHVKRHGGAAGHYGMKNVGEFVAEAFTNPEFQRALKAMPAPAGNVLKSAWDSLVRILKSILGLQNNDTSALAKALELGVEVMRENMLLRQQAVAARQGAEAQAGVNQDDDAFFGAADLRAIKSRGLELAHNALTHPGKVSLWDKTVGTMRHIAERYPAFKPVFDAAQQFLDDVASVANEAADMAPRLIPRVDTMRDMLKKPISVADNRAIGKALFSGTLDWGRDQHGKAMPMNELRAKYANLSVDTKSEILMASGKVQPQVIAMWRGKELAQYETLINNKFESTILKSGVRFSHEELRKFFNLNEQQISLYDEARATVDKSLDLTARAEMLRKLGRDWDFMRDMVMDAPTLTEAWKLLHEELEQRAKEIPDSRDQMAAKMFEIRASFDKAQELMEHGYMPLQRFGKYTVDVVDENGERVYFSMFESKAESNKMAQALRREYPNARVVQGTMNDQQFKLFAGITPETAELFGSMLGLDADGQDAKDQAFQEYLKLAKNNHSALKRLIHRKGIAGYSEDVGRVLASFVYSNARLAATGLNAGKMEQAINTLQTEHKEQGELGEIAAKLRSYIQDPQEEGHVIRGMLFAQYLGGSVASAAVNMTQPFAVTLPWLTQYGGMAAAGRYLAGALRDMAKRGHKYEADLAHALKMAEDDGVVSPQEIHQLMAQARGAGGLRTGDGTKLGDARAQAANLWEKVKVGWGQPFALAEQFNRRSTFIAAYRLAKDRKLGNPAEFARRAVLETQFLYSKANKPQWARGAVGGTLFTFKTYSVSFLELMHRMWTQGGPEGKRAVGWAMAMLLLMGGAGGLPFMEDLEDLIDGAGQMMGYNVSAKQWRQQLLRDVLGAELAGFIEQGMSGLPGAPVDVSGRLGMGNLIPGTGLLLDKQSNARDVVELLGPAGDLVQRGMQAMKSVASGVVNADPTSIGRGVMEVMPTAVRNAAKGVDMAASGIYKDTKGYKVIDTTLDEAVAKFLGFQPRSVAEVQEANSFMQRAKSFYIQTSNEIKAQWAKALFEKDAAGVERARQRVKEWNEKNPDQPIRVNMRDIWERVRQMGKDRTARIADTAPKALRQQLRDMAQEQSR